MENEPNYRVCSQCGEAFELEEFRIKGLKFRPLCRECHKFRKWSRARERAGRPNLKDLYRLKLIKEFGSKCQVCGYSEYSAALHFHHVHPDEKGATVGHYLKATNLRKSDPLEDARQEALKCILLCSNCHAAVHAHQLELEVILTSDRFLVVKAINLLLQKP